MKTKLLLTSLPLTLSLLIVACSDSSDSRPAPEPLLARYVLSSTDSVPEGVTFDPVARDFYASSLQGASITRINPAGDESLLRAADNRASIGGIKVDADRRLLWACATDADGMGDRVWVFDLDSGDLDTEFELQAISTGGSCNDLILDAAGIAYVTDPANPNIYRLDRDSGEGEILASDPRLADVTGIGLGLNGIEVTPAEDALIVARFTPPAFFRVSLPNGDSIEQVALSGDALPTPDGLEFVAGDLYSVANQEVSRTRFNADYSAGTVVTRPYTSGLSTAANAEGRLYVIKSEVTNFVIGNPLQTPFEIFEIALSDFDTP